MLMQVNFKDVKAGAKAASFRKNLDLIFQYDGKK